ncbi:unnamed protein product, partial [Musa hybrid cultivar]
LSKNKKLKCTITCQWAASLLHGMLIISLLMNVIEDPIEYLSTGKQEWAWCWQQCMTTITSTPRALSPHGSIKSSSCCMIPVCPTTIFPIAWV